MKLRQLVLVIAILILINLIFANENKLDLTRIEDYRIISEIWGTLKYLHPTAEKNKLEWNQAFQKAIKGLDTAENPNLYTRIDTMLQTLDDPHTFIYRKEELNKTDSTALNSVELEDKIVYLRLNDYSKFNLPETDSLITQAISYSKKAQGMVIDLRHLNGYAYDLYYYLRKDNFLEYLINKDICSNQKKFIEYSGYPSEKKRNYYQKKYVLESDIQIIKSKRKEEEIPITFIINKTCYPNLKLQALSFNEKAYFISVDKQCFNDRAITLDFEFFSIDASFIKDKIRKSVYKSYVDTFLQKDFSENEIVEIAKESFDKINKKNLSVQKGFDATNKDVFKSQNNYPNKEERVMALAKLYWVIDNFDPHKDLMSLTPKDNFSQSLPRFIEAKDSLEYNQAIGKFINKLNDSHSWINSPTFNRNYKHEMIPIILEKINNKFYIANTKYIKYLTEHDLKIGDEVIKINGKPILNRFNDIRQYMSYSNSSSSDYFTTFFVTWDSEDKLFEIEFKRKNKIFTRKLKSMKRNELTPYLLKEKKDTIKVLEDNIGYVNLAILQKKDIEKIFEKCKNTKGLIFDMRGYPKNIMWELAKYFVNGKKVMNINEIPRINNGIFSKNFERNIISKTIVHGKGKKYNKPVVVLMYGGTQSQAEATCSMLKEFANATLIGTQTSGADGNTTYIYLPGNVYVSFTGMNAMNPHFKSEQGVGLLPDIEVHKTAAGIKAGRDEILEKAIEYLKDKTGK